MPPKTAIGKAFYRVGVKALRYSFGLRLRYGGYSIGRILAGRCGFFGNMFMTLNGIRLCEAAGVQAQPCWDEESLFHEPTRGANAWLYYFKEIPPMTPRLRPAADAVKRKVLSFKPTAHTIVPLYPGLDIRASYAECIRRHVRLRDEIHGDLENLTRRLFNGEHILGVHIRLTDTTRGVENRKSFALDQFYRAIDSYLTKQPQSRIFVASDSAPAVEAVRGRYGDRIISLDCIRSSDGTSIHGHYDVGISQSPYQKGLDVVRDAYLLSRVHHLVRVNSRVTAFSLCLSPKLTFTDISTMDNPAQPLGVLPWLQNSDQTP